MKELSNELVNLIVSFLGKEDLSNMRLVSSAISAHATEYLFETVRLKNTDESGRIVGHILDNPELTKFTHHFIFDTSFNERPHNESTVSGNFGLEDSVHAATLRLCRLNLWKLSIQLGYEYFHSIHEKVGSRTLIALFKALDEASEFTPNLRSLSISCLGELHVEILELSKHVRSVLGRITSLKVGMVEKLEIYGREDWYRQKRFFGGLLDVWLQPVAKNLTHLTLTSGTMFGFIPKLDLRQVHFPRIRALVLDNYSFSHEWQLQWILGHAGTLEELYIEGCTVYYAWNYQTPFDEENYPMPIHDNSDIPAITHFSGLKWSLIFDAFERSLGKLRVFRFDAGDYINEDLVDMYRDLEEMEELGMKLKSRLDMFMYQFYNRRLADTSTSREYPGGVDHPYCELEDEMSLRRLLSTTERRNNG